jgi:hypothetical protein
MLEIFMASALHVNNFSWLICPTDVKLNPDYEYAAEMPPGTQTTVWAIDRHTGNAYQCVYISTGKRT